MRRRYTPFCAVHRGTTHPQPDAGPEARRRQIPSAPSWDWRASGGRGGRSASPLKYSVPSGRPPSASAGRTAAPGYNSPHRPPWRVQDRCSYRAAPHTPAWSPWCSPPCRKSPAARRRWPGTAAAPPRRRRCSPPPFPRRHGSRRHRPAGRYPAPRSWKQHGGRRPNPRSPARHRPSCSRPAGT